MIQSRRTVMWSTPKKSHGNSLTGAWSKSWAPEPAQIENSNRLPGVVTPGPEQGREVRVDPCSSQAKFRFLRRKMHGLGSLSSPNPAVTPTGDTRAKWGDTQVPSHRKDDRGRGLERKTFRQG